MAALIKPILEEYRRHRAEPVDRLERLAEIGAAIAVAPGMGSSRQRLLAFIEVVLTWLSAGGAPAHVSPLAPLLAELQNGLVGLEDAQRPRVEAIVAPVQPTSETKPRGRPLRKFGQVQHAVAHAVMVYVMAQPDESGKRQGRRAAAACLAALTKLPAALFLTAYNARTRSDPRHDPDDAMQIQPRVNNDEELANAVRLLRELVGRSQ